LGLGGVGKSRIALELADRTRSQRPTHSIFWIQATDPLTFEKDFFEIGKKLEVPGLEDEKADVKSLVKQRLNHESAGKWLIILDNADDEAFWGRKTRQSVGGIALAEYLPNSSKGSILVTTRSRRVATHLAGKEVVELLEMGQDEAIDTLKSLLARPETLDNTDAALDLLEKLTFLPLAIVQAAAYINTNDESIQVYLDLLNDTEENVIELLSEDFGDDGRYKEAQNAVASTWLISFNQIRLHCPLAAEYLSFMSCLNEKNIPQSLLPDAPSKKKMIDATGTLIGYSFLRKQNQDHAMGTLYDMHRLVRLATRNWLRDQNTLLNWTETTTKRVAELFPEVEHENKDKWTLYMPHTQTLCAFDIGGDLKERYFLLERMGLCLMADGKYNEAVKVNSSVVLWREKKLSCLHEDTLRAYNHLGRALDAHGYWSGAERYLKQAYEGQKRELSPEHPDILTSMAGLASIYGNQGRWKEAEELQGQVVEMRRRVLGAEHPDTLDSIGNLALTYRKQGRWKEAEELQVQVVEMRKRVQGAEHPDTLTSIGNLALTYWNQGRWKEAEELEVQVMEMRKRVLGAEHPDTLDSIGNLASTYGNQGRWKEAEELEVQVMEMRKRVLGAEHPDTLTSIGNLAGTYGNQGRWKDAEELEVQVMEMKKRVLGAEHPDTLTSIGNLAGTYGNQGRWKDAEELGMQVVEMRKRVQGAEHPDTLTSIGNLASTYGNQGRWKEAEELQIQVMEMRKRVQGAEHPDTLQVMSNLAVTYRRQGRWEEAMELMAKSAQLSLERLGDVHPATQKRIASLEKWRQEEQ
jgi:tetratricopeptide (TPR) repeat protein